VPASFFNSLFITFQFHFGAIKSLAGSNYIYPFWHFNSTLVRLKGIADTCLTIFLTNFNSTLVRLKAGQN